MLRDLVASRRGRIVHAVRVFTHVTAPIPARGWYLNIHQGNSGDILSNGQPTIFFRPLICANIRPGTAALSVSAILGPGEVVTGVRAATAGNVVLTGGKATGSGTQNDPFLYQGQLGDAARGSGNGADAAVSRSDVGDLIGPDTHSANPAVIPAGQVRAVGAYVPSAAPSGVVNQGMVYLGPVSGPGGSWTSISVPADGTSTVGGARACPSTRTGCFVMDTIAHSTMGDLVVGNYDLNPSVPGGLVSGNGFIYNLATQRWTLLDLGGSMSSGSSLYGIWQDGGPASPDYTLGRRLLGQRAPAGLPHELQRGHRRLRTAEVLQLRQPPGAGHALRRDHRGRQRLDLVAISSAQDASMAFVPVVVDGGACSAWSCGAAPSLPCARLDAGRRDREHRLSESGHGALRTHRSHSAGYLPRHHRERLAPGKRLRRCHGRAVGRVGDHADR